MTVALRNRKSMPDYEWTFVMIGSGLRLKGMSSEIFTKIITIKEWNP